VKLLLVGAGGHSRAIAEAANQSGHQIVAVSDPRPDVYLMGVSRFSDDAAELPGEIEGIVIGVGGVSPRQLERRFALYESYRARGLAAPAIVHPTAWISESAVIGAGVVVLARAVVQPGAVLDEACIANTGCIVEHDTFIGAGAHIAPAACVLGTVNVGRAAMVGAGSVVLPGSTVADGGLVPAQGRYPEKSENGDPS
jgi:UDP-perosamine 4-acetyltransferase